MIFIFVLVKCSSNNNNMPRAALSTYSVLPRFTITLKEGSIFWYEFRKEGCAEKSNWPSMLMVRVLFSLLLVAVTDIIPCSWYGLNSIDNKTIIFNGACREYQVDVVRKRVFLYQPYQIHNAHYKIRNLFQFSPVHARSHVSPFLPVIIA